MDEIRQDVWLHFDRKLSAILCRLLSFRGCIYCSCIALGEVEGCLESRKAI